MVIDSSALFAMLQGEPEAEACMEAVTTDARLFIAAPTLTEALIVAAGRELHGEMAALIDRLDLTVEPLTVARAYAAVSGYTQWGKGFHRAKLNFADSFAYALAKEHGCPLLFVGNDFAQTDVEPAFT